MRVNMLSVIYLVVFSTSLFKTTTCNNKQGSTEFVIEGSRICTVVTAGLSDYRTFFPLSDITDITVEKGYLVKVPITITTEYGFIRIILSETDSWVDTIRYYAFVVHGFTYESRISRTDNVNDYDYEHDTYESISGRNHVNDYDYDVNSTSAEYIVPLNTNISVELSVSASGVVKFLYLDTQFEFQLIDTLDVIPVKYIAFGAHETKYTFNCSTVPETVDPLVPSRGFSLFSSTPTFVIFFKLLSSLLYLFGA